ncbi:putative tetratricopeptide-like helical domain superfamily [Helianthus annuus]|nr:putative tetratricopeptide-like helical domain superfamily [Helianthus annuus]
MITRLNSRLHCFIKLTGNFITTSFLLPSSSRLGLQFTPHSTSLASLLHSTSFSNNRDRPLLSRYQKVTNLDDAFNLFDEMTQRRPLPSVVKFNQLLSAVTKMKHFSSCLDLFKQMCVIGVPVSKYSMNIAIKCFCQMSRTNDVFALLGCCFRRAVVPDVLTFSTLLDGLIREDRIIEAKGFFKKLIKQKLCEPDVVMYSTMIKGLCKFGNNDIAIGLLRLMDQRGCNPNVVVYSTIIDSLCKDKMIDDAFKLFNEMEGRVDEAEAVIDIMVERGEVPNIVTYNSLIDGYCLRGEMTKANSLLNGYCKSLKIEEAMHLFHEITRKGLKPDIVLYA